MQQRAQMMEAQNAANNPQSQQAMQEMQAVMSNPQLMQRMQDLKVPPLTPFPFSAPATAWGPPARHLAV